jgi:Domain of unknown function (DUF4062)
MARPRIFISSTFYDLRHVRADLDRFITEFGYDAVSNERGDIPYGSDQSLEEYCYKEIENCDILVSIVGGRFGSESRHPGPSISQMEVKNAIELGKQLYVFVDADVLAELKTYRLNKETLSTKYAYADDIRIFKFLDELDALSSNNTRFSFRETSDILTILREQWAGLFQRLLRTQARQEEVRMINALRETAKSLDELVRYNTEQSKSGDSIVSQILLPSHPIFAHLSEKLGVAYRIYFKNLTEMRAWLKARSYNEVKTDISDEFYVFDNSYYRPRKTGGRDTIHSRLSVNRSLFSNGGDLKIMSEANWKDNFIGFEQHIVQPATVNQTDDEIPF